jgi:hypothetical protein
MNSKILKVSQRPTCSGGDCENVFRRDELFSTQLDEEPVPHNFSARIEKFSRFHTSIYVQLALNIHYKTAIVDRREL